MTAPKTDSQKLKPMTVEFGDDHCRNMVLMTTRIRVRGKFSHIVLASREQGPRDTGEMAGMPEMPGQQCTLDFAEMTMTIRDPLEDPEHEKTLKRATIVAKKAMILPRTKEGDKGFQPVDSITSKLDPDKFKTQLIEIGKMLFPAGATRDDPKTGDIKAVLVNGSRFPTAAQIKDMPGDELFDPGSNSSTQPRYKRDSEAWMRELDQRR